ncbi:RHS repeat-associated core domain-containing protein [Bacteroides nordii]|uniref:RHS repeat-associated core domain-containing protein n=1 Tax=Bacteroides nordii TaxID=291645 RepID=UPI00189C1819|nr:RHS repeat-associated core domain-containing protein [Bacteroides nordii]
MKRLIIYIVGLIVAISSQAQISLKDLVNIPIDTIGPKGLVIDSAAITRSTIPEIRSTHSFDGELHPHIPNSYAIDRTKDVGEIKCNTAVGPSGAMTMSIPLEVYPDPRGFTPQIALNYNSLGGNGPLGNGWNLSGASVIAVINKSIYYDGQTSGITTASPTCSFSLDGQRLLQVGISSTFLTYQTEQGNIKVKGYYGSDSVMTSFEAYFPDGRCAWYETNNGVTFYVTRMKDRADNEIYYSYTSLQNHYRLSRVTYGSAKQAWVDFHYATSRPDIQVVYSAGRGFRYDYLLSSVSTNLLGSVQRVYSLTYATQGGVSVISKVDCTASGHSLNPLILYYGDNQQIPTYQKEDTQLVHWYNFDEAWQVRTVKGKFDYGTDNDGIIMLPNKVHYVEYWRKPGTFRHSRSHFENQYTGDETIVVATGLSGKMSEFNPELKTEYGFIDIFCMDVDEVEGEEIVKINNYVAGDLDKVDFHVYTSDLFAGIAKKYTRSFSFNTLLTHRDTKSINPKFYYTGDFNGDGKMEILVVSASNALGKGAPSMCYLIDLEGNKILYEGSPFSFWQQFPKYGDDTISADEAANGSHKIYAIDYDGDGKTELCWINDSETQIYSFSKVGERMVCNKVASDIQLRNGMLRDRDLLLGEFNGDNKTDFLLSPPKGGSASWNIFTSEGDGTFNVGSITMTIKTTSNRFILQDMNADGQTDLVEIYSAGPDARLQTYFIADCTNKGTKIITVPNETILIPTNIQSRNFYSKLIGLQTGGIASRITYQNDDSKNRLLTGIVNSYGIVTKVGYQRLNDESSRFYSPGSGAQFPYQNYKGGLTVANSVTTYCDSVMLSNASYEYSNAIIHKQGLGFRGFGEVKVYDYVTDKYTSQTFDPQRFSVPIKDESYEHSNVYTYNIAITANKIAQIRLTNKVSTDKLKNVSLTGSYIYDTYGNVLKEIINYGNGLETVQSNTFQNINENSIYILGLPLTQEVTKKRNGEAAIVGLTKCVYNTNYLPIKKEQYITSSDKVKEEVFEYDDKFNLICTKTKDYSSTHWLEVRYTYNSNGQLTRKTDPLGLYEDYSYDSNGFRYSVKNHKNHITTYTYDAWGRKIQTAFPDGTTENSTAKWITSPTGALILMTTTATGQPDQEVYTDALGREVRIGEKRFNGKYLYTDKVYDNKGRLQQSSLPFKGKASLWNRYTYDQYDRLTGVDYASGKTDSYSYNGLSETSVINGLPSKKTYNAAGELVTVEDGGGTITYNYRVDGQLSSIEAPGGVTTLFGYDRYLRQTKLVDPSAGIKTFEYDAAGNISRETDANGKVTQTIYDAYNRITRKEQIGEFITNYIYNSDGLLVSESGTNGSGKTYIYDDLMRLSTEREEAVDDKWLQKTYTYTDGNISSIAYASQTGDIATENYTYANGTLSGIRLNNWISIWQLQSEDDLGLLTNETTGPLNHVYSYDRYGHPTQRIVATQFGIVHFSTYNFSSQTGNLNWRKDDMRQLQENFGYDALNRLTSFGGKTMTYDEKGNITDYTTVGKFDYSTTKPYAIELVTPYGDAISLRNQAVTYNAMMRPVFIFEDDYTAILEYNGNADRIKMELEENDTNILTRYYIGNQYELDLTNDSIQEKLYLGGDAYSAPAVYVKKDDGNWDIYYICRDYLGSITHVIDPMGSLVQELSYDAWGRLRDPENHELYAPGDEPALFLGRGYTGHEHLAVFGLINMNARLYDPALGRFLSPDPYVQAPDFSQNFNRYSYCLNNPLLYTDPTGEYFLIDDLISAIIGGVVNVVINVVQGNVHSFGQGAAFFGAGALSGVITIYVGPIAGAAVLGASNNILSQGFNNGWGNISWDQVGSSAVMGAATSYLGASLGNALSGPIQNLTSGIASPVLREALTQGALNATTGFALSTGMALGTGSSLGDALKQGGQGAAFGVASGVISGAVKGVGEVAQAKKAAQGGTNSVYQGTDAEGKVRYVGITERDPNVRFNEHLNSGTNRAGLKYTPVPGTGNLPRMPARIMEQNLINKYGMQKNGGQLYNQRNSISPKFWNGLGIKK